MADYIVGQEVTMRVQFTDEVGEPADPLTVNFYYQDGGGGGVVNKHTRLGGVTGDTADDDITRTDVGAYEFKYVLVISGRFNWRWEAPDETDATIVDAHQGSFTVDPAIPDPALAV
jgi:hypothetical protein